MSEATMGEILSAVVEKHLPGSRAPEGIGTGRERRSARWARSLLQADIHCDERFGVSRDKEALEELVRAAKKLQEALKAVSWSTADTVDGEALAQLDLLHHGIWQPGDPSLVLEAHNTAGRLAKAANKVLKEHRPRRDIGKANWRAASVAGQCRLIWADERFRETHGEPVGNALMLYSDDPAQGAQYRNYAGYLESGAPKDVHGSRPAKLGNFAGFVEDIFEALGLVDDAGAPLPASSALRTWREGRQQKMGTEPSSG